MSKTIGILATMDTKGEEAHFMRQEIEKLGAKALLIDIGIVGEKSIDIDISTKEIIEASGKKSEDVLKNPNRQDIAPVLIQGTATIALELIRNDKIHALVALGGTQGTSNCSQIMQQLPYGFPKIILSTVASGDTSPFVDIKDITMMFSVSDILGLNPFSRKILANAAAAAFGMAQVEHSVAPSNDSGKPVIGMTNLGVLTNGAMHAIKLFEAKGYDVITFHAIGAGGRAMEQMIKEGIIGAVFDYALGEISDELFDGLRAANEERLTVAGKKGIPQVICPGGTEHIGLLLHTPNKVPEKYINHQYTFHNPIIFAPRLNTEELKQVAVRITDRLKHTTKDAIFMMPLKGVSRYTCAGGEIENPEEDKVFWEALKENMPKTIELQSYELGAEDPEFVETAVNSLIGLIEKK